MRARHSHNSIGDMKPRSVYMKDAFALGWLPAGPLYLRPNCGQTAIVSFPFPPKAVMVTFSKQEHLWLGNWRLGNFVPLVFKACRLRAVTRNSLFFCLCIFLIKECRLLAWMEGRRAKALTFPGGCLHGGRRRRRDHPHTMSAKFLDFRTPTCHCHCQSHSRNLSALSSAFGQCCLVANLIAKLCKTG